MSFQSVIKHVDIYYGGYGLIDRVYPEWIDIWSQLNQNINASINTSLNTSLRMALKTTPFNLENIITIFKSDGIYLEDDFNDTLHNTYK
jgi:hypothetical protein